MISYDDALALVLTKAKPGPPIAKPLKDCAGLVLAEDLTAPFPLPRFDNSAVDGYALGEAPGAQTLTVVRTIGAGEDPGAPLHPGECARIFTGAPIPPGCYAVAMQEDAKGENGRISVCVEVEPNQNIRRKGEEFQAGEVVLAANSLLNTAGIALAASLGAGELPVYSPPRVAIVSTGAELRELHQELGLSQIFESNSYSLHAALGRLGIDPVSAITVNDDVEATFAVIADQLQQCDVLITTGGVSVGDRDVVKHTFERLEIETVFWGVAIKPGKPVYFGMKEEKAVFGLPGNPMSVLATFALLVQPYLKACLGERNMPNPRFRAELLARIKHKTGRREFVPGQLRLLEDGMGVLPITGQGSHMLGGLARANAWIDVAEDVLELSQGDQVWIYPFGMVAV